VADLEFQVSHQLVVIEGRLRRRYAMSASDVSIFAWAITKVALILISSFGVMGYLLWIVAKKL